MNTTRKKPEKVKTNGIVRKIANGKIAPIIGRDAAIYAQAIELLRPAGTPLLTAVARYAEAVEILGGDRILEAARDFRRQNPKRLQRRAVRVGTPNGEPISICTPTELRGLLAAAPGWSRPILAIQAFAGLRASEMLRLDWENVKLDRGHIEVGLNRTKTEARRLAPIPPNLVRWLARAAKSSGRVFPYSRANFDEIRASVAKAAGVAWKENALRHSFIGYRLAQTSDAPRVARESGTSPGIIFKHYSSLMGEMDARQWFTIAP